MSLVAAPSLGRQSSLAGPPPPVADTQVADGADPIDQTQPAAVSTELVPAAEDAAASNKRPREEEANGEPGPEKMAKGFKAPTLLRNDKLWLNQIAACIDKQNPKDDARDRFYLEELFTDKDRHRTALEIKWRALLLERAFSDAGDDCTLTTYDFFNRELYKLHKVLMLVSRKLSYDASKPHYFAANEERNKYEPPSFAEQLSAQPRRG